MVSVAVIADYGFIKFPWVVAESSNDRSPAASRDFFDDIVAEVSRDLTNGHVHFARGGNYCETG